MTNLNRYKPVGWRGESHRHYLASKGIMTSGADIMQKSNMMGRVFDLKTSFNDGEKIVPGVGKAGEDLLPRAFKAGENEEFVPGAEKTGENYTGGAYNGAVEYAAEKRVVPDTEEEELDESPEEEDEEEQKYYSAKDVASYMAEEDMVTFTPEQARAFKKRYQEAEASGETQFTWEGRPVLTGYAKYMIQYMESKGYKAEKGARVQLHPGTDRWMMGDRYGEVVKESGDTVHVKLDKSGKTMRFPKDRVELVRFDAEKTPYAHVPSVRTPAQVKAFEERTGRRHQGEPLTSYWKRAATEEVPDRDVML